MAADRVPTPVTIVSRSGRESSRVKGIRLLAEGRLTVFRIDQPPARAWAWFAHARGEDRTYDCGFAKGRWWCTCPARGKCSHLVALAKVIDVAAWEGAS